MERPISKTTIFVDGASRFNDLIYLIAKDRKLAKEDVAHTRFIGFDQLKFAHMGDRNWNAVAVCVAKRPAEKMIAIGEDGEVFTYVGGKASDEAIKPAPIALRALGVIDGFPYACGMKRQVYRRLAENTWAAMHAPPPAQGQNAGFEGIAGFNANEIYTAGWNGEIWQWDSSTWVNQPSPTNLILTGICCAGDGKVYICGQNGTLLRGRNIEWEVIELQDFRDDFWDLCWFNDTLYLSTMTGVYTFKDSTGIQPVDFGGDRPKTCYKLTDAQGVLWSVGSDDVFAFDGAAWSRVD